MSCGTMGWDVMSGHRVGCHFQVKININDNDCIDVGYGSGIIIMGHTVRLE